MRAYELTFIVRPDVSEDGLNDAIAQVQTWITDQGEGNTVRKVDRWGRRRLAYSIRDHREGHYVLIEADLAATTLPEIERNLKLSDTVIRYLLVRAEEPQKEETEAETE